MRFLNIATAAALLLGTAGAALANDNIPSPGAEYGQGIVNRELAAREMMRGPMVYEGRSAYVAPAPVYEGRSAYVAPLGVPAPIPFLSTPADVATVAPAGIVKYSPQNGTNIE